MAKHIFACLTLLLTASLAFGASVNYGDITVAHDFQPGGQPSHGYTEYRIVITNKSSDRTRLVRVEFPGSTFSGPGGGGLRGISRTVSVSPGTSSVVSLLQPATPNAVGEFLRTVRRLHVSVVISCRGAAERLAPTFRKSAPKKRETICWRRSWRQAPRSPRDTRRR